MSDIDTQQQIQQPEEPVFLIERVEQTAEQPQPPRYLWLHRLAVAGAVLALVLLALWGYRSCRHLPDLDLPLSATPEENIEKLQRGDTLTVAKDPPGVVHTQDSILGVALDFYALHGVSASLEWQEPDTLDRSVFLYCRSADHKADSLYLGSLVVGGEEKPAYEGRLGYMAMADGRYVIGVSASDAVKDYVAERGGSFFRQMVLLSNGVLPNDFELHGKVERKAIARIGERYYFVVTRSKETMWDFADALREYGFLDAIYITGGDNYSYYRTADGQKHDIGDVAGYPHKKWKGIIPWLVFRQSTTR